MKYIVKKLIFIAVVALTITATPVLAWEGSGNLSTGLNGIIIVAPTASPVAGTYTSTQSVALTAIGASNVLYTTDDTAPTCSTGTVYSSPISVLSSQTIKAISCYQDNHFSSVVSFAYVINLTVSSNQISSLLDPSALALPEGASVNSTLSLQAKQNITIDNTVGAGVSTVTLPANTTITSVSGQNFDATALTANNPVAGTLSGLTTGAVIDGSLQWGIVNLGLQFSDPITISIYVGDSLNGQTLNIMRSTSGASGWTSDGIVSPATCVVSGGLCAFSATKASYYAVYHTTNTSVKGGRVGRGDSGDHTAPTISNVNITVSTTAATITWTTNEPSISWVVYGTSTSYGSEVKTATYNTFHSLVLSNFSPATTYHYLVQSKDSVGNINSYTDESFTTIAFSQLNSAVQKGDANGDNKIDVLDFNTLMVNWGKAGAGNIADFNSDDKVDIFDFNLLMINWII